MKEDYDLFIDEAKQLETEFKEDTFKDVNSVMREAYRIMENELIMNGSPYTVSLIEEDVTEFIIRANDSTAAFNTEIGGPFDAPGSSFTENDPNQIFRRGVQKIEKLLSKFKANTGIDIRITYTIENPTFTQTEEAE